MSSVNPVIAEMLAWADEFEAGMINDPALVDGTLAPDETVAVRIGPVTEVTLAIGPEPTVASTAGTGTLVATDRRVLLLAGGDGRREPRQWWWATDVERVTILRDGLGVGWAPSEARVDAGLTSIEGLVVPELVRGARLRPEEVRVTFPAFLKVEVAWRASQAGGLGRWRTEFRDRYRA